VRVALAAYLLVEALEIFIALKRNGEYARPHLKRVPK
jgi:hypothetical protein